MAIVLLVCSLLGIGVRESIWGGIAGLHRNVGQVREFLVPEAPEKKCSEEANSGDQGPQICFELFQDIHFLWTLHSFHVVSNFSITITFFEWHGAGGIQEWKLGPCICQC